MRGGGAVTAVTPCTTMGKPSRQPPGAGFIPCPRKGVRELPTVASERSPGWGNNLGISEEKPNTDNSPRVDGQCSPSIPPPGTAQRAALLPPSLVLYCFMPPQPPPPQAPAEPSYWTSDLRVACFRRVFPPRCSVVAWHKGGLAHWWLGTLVAWHIGGLALSWLGTLVAWHIAGLAHWWLGPMVRLAEPRHRSIAKRRLPRFEQHSVVVSALVALLVRALCPPRKGCNLSS
ncbi:hypothetical protein NDU88_003263 [Pleurodeles waltl]|uniref:Uncharacterized protein n=1 Tax=Pleurodeles waltl TaxID=8319 RepID=A0AAV7SG79_PLEWA|nr:hypothetical protein NDU88_003263 [Pleurodeles waltl]